jgi:hypothetical protein
LGGEHGREGVKPFTHVGQADAQQNQERQRKKDQQPQVGDAQHRAPAGA